MKVYIVYDSDEHYIISVYSSKKRAFDAIVNSYMAEDEKQEARESLELNGGYDDYEIIERDII